MKYGYVLSALCGVLVFVSCNAGSESAVGQMQKELSFSEMRVRWSERLTGNSLWQDGSVSDVYRSIISQTDRKAESARSLLVRDSNTRLFSDLDLEIAKKLGSDSTASDMSVDYWTAAIRLQDMARAWASQGSRLYHDAALRTDILYAIRWYHDHVFNARLDSRAMFGNWWHWWIGIPRDLSGALILMHDELAPDLLQAESRVLERFNEDPRYVYKVKGAAGKMEMTAANLADTSLVSLLRGAFSDDARALSAGIASIGALTAVVSEGEGIYADGSFIQHSNLAYTGGYGATLLNSLEKLVYLTAGSPWQAEDAVLMPLYEWILKGVRPLYADGAMFDMVSGRGIARPGTNDMSIGRSILAAVVLLADYASPDIQRSLYAFAKAEIGAGISAMGEKQYYSGMGAAAMKAAMRIMSQDSIPAEALSNTAQIFAVMDKAVVHRKNFSLGISYASERIGRFESGNGENLKGWHQGDGLTFLYTGGRSRFTDNFWNTVDPLRLPGITTDGSTWPVRPWSNDAGNGSFNGGAVMGPYMSLAMDFKNYDTADNPNLAVRKAWFAFDDEVAALGSNLKGADPGRTTETIVENMQLHGTARLIADGREASVSSGTRENLSALSYAWFTDAFSSSGFYFPGTALVTVLREERQGSWRDINSSAGISAEPVSRSYMSLSLPHTSAAPQSQRSSYAYVLLPGYDLEKTEAYAASPGIKILSNTGSVQAVRDLSSGAEGYVFWGEGRERIGDIEGERGVLTLIRDSTSRTLWLSMADPQQEYDSLRFRVWGNGLSVAEHNPLVSVSVDAGGTTITVNTRGARGASRIISLKY